MLITEMGKGGAQRVFYDHASALAADFEVEEAVFDCNESERLLNSHLPLYDLKGNKRFILSTPVDRLLARAKVLTKLVSKQQSKVVISHMDGANWINALSKSKAKRIFVVHGSILHDRGQPPFKQWLRKKMIIPLLYKKANVVVAVSDGIAQELTDYFRLKNVISIPNFFDINEIEQKAAEPLPNQYDSLFSNNKILITSGRFSEQKKQHFLFSIFKKINAQFSDTRLVLLGDGKLRNKLINEAKEQKLKVYSIFDTTQVFHNDYDVYFLGYLSNPYQYLKRSTLFLFPSGWEGFPLALCEAMIAGVPVISADCPTGPRQILAPDSIKSKYDLPQAEYTESGVLMPMVDHVAASAVWEECVAHLLQNEIIRENMIAKARQRMLCFERNVVLKQWKDLIDGLLQNESV